jgi:hypothetical protein
MRQRYSDSNPRRKKQNTHHQRFYSEGGAPLPPVMMDYFALG